MFHVRQLISTLACATVCCLSVTAYADDDDSDHHHHQPDCESWESASIVSIDENGRKITMDDGSVWRIDERAAETAVQWQPNAGIDICDDHTLTNTDEGESVHARQIH